MNDTTGGVPRVGLRRAGENDRHRSAAWIVALSSLVLHVNMILFLGHRSKMILFESEIINSFGGKLDTTPTPYPSNSTTIGYVRYPKIFGHLHYAKTAGTEINGELAFHFERVCGHKGYSYDAYQLHARQEKHLAEIKSKIKNGTVNITNRFVNEVRTLGAFDSISQTQPMWNRGRVPEMHMLERGFEDCDWISLESSWKFWSKVLPDYPIELHVPCRDPLEHLMSQCNHMRKTFDCTATNLQKELDKCLVSSVRFHANLRKDARLALKCFDPIPIDPYLEYMGQFLERKRIETDYIHRATNAPRNKTNECIWEQIDVQKRVMRLLGRMDYYQFCNECMGSDDDLLR
jgi:hypothetical protein